MMTVINDPWKTVGISTGVARIQIAPIVLPGDGEMPATVDHFEVTVWMNAEVIASTDAETFTDAIVCAGRIVKAELAREEVRPRESAPPTPPWDTPVRRAVTAVCAASLFLFVVFSCIITAQWFFGWS